MDSCIVIIERTSNELLFFIQADSKYMIITIIDLGRGLLWTFVTLRHELALLVASSCEKLALNWRGFHCVGRLQSCAPQ